MSDNEQKQPPEELVAQCKEITEQWLTLLYVVAEPYFFEGDIGSGWRIRIVDTVTKDVLCDHLTPVCADGHTYRMFIDGLRQREKMVAKKSAALTLAHLVGNLATMTGVSRSDLIDAFNTVYCR